MKNLGLVIAVSITLLMTTTNAFAGTELVCEARGKVDGIIEIHAQDSYPEKQYCVFSTAQKGSLPKVETKFCSNGSIDDSTVLLSSELQNGIGTTQVKIQKNADTYTLVKTFDCDWVNGEEHCQMNSPTDRLHDGSRVINGSLFQINIRV